jgi:hypothetical protein
MQRDDEWDSQLLRDGQHRTRIDSEVRVYDPRAVRRNRPRKSAGSSGSQKDPAFRLFIPGF